MHEEFMALLMDEESFRTARAVAEGRGYPSAVVQQGGLDVLADMLEEVAPPRVLLLDLDREKEPLEAAKRAMGLCGTDCRILFLGSRNDITLYRRFKQLGAVDYLVKPLAEDVLRDALTAALDAKREDVKPKNSETRSGHIVPVIGVRGGVGATTVAVNLAWICAHRLQQHAGLLDLDMHFGTSALAIDREPGRGMRAALENPERLDGLLIASSMVQESERLSILCAEESFDHPVHFDGEATLSLIKPVAGNFDTVFVDMPRSMIGMQKRLFAQAHAIVIVCDQSLASLRDARRVRAYLKAIRPDLLPVMIANRVNEYASLDKTTFEKNLEAKIDFELADDGKLAKSAANLGKTFADVAPSSEITKQLVGAARLISNMPEEKKASVSGGKLLGLFDGLGLHHKHAPKPA